MKKILICLLLALTTVLCAVPMLATSASADEGAPTGDSATLLTPEDIYVPGATISLSAFAGESNITADADGNLLWKDERTGLSYPLVGSAANIVGTYTYDHVSGFDEGSLTVAVESQKVHSDLYRATLKIYTDPALDPASYVSCKVVSGAGNEVVACRSVLVIEAKDADGNWSSDPTVASYEMGGWSAGENGGIGYELPDFYYNDKLVGLPLQKHLIDLGDDSLPAGEMTFEIVTSIVGAIDTDGYKTTLSKHTGYEGDGEWCLGYRIGALQIWPRVTSPLSPGYNPGMGKANITYLSAASKEDGILKSHLKEMSGITNGSVIAVTKASVDANYTYTVSMQGQEITSMTTGTTFQYIPNESLKGARFEVAREMSQTVYAIRVYDKALTTEQLAQNHFADLAKFYDLDLASFSAMPAEFRQTIYDAFTPIDFSQKTEEIQAVLDETISNLTYVPEQNQYDRLYVQDGLTILLTAYDHTDKNVSLVNGNGTWQNKIADENGEYKKFSIVGQNLSFAFTDVDGVIHEGNTAWRKIEGGGIGYEATLRQMQNGLNNYVDIGIENLPNSHTVEMIFDPYGAYLDGTESYRQDSGLAERWGYIITAGNIGIYSKHTIAKDAGVSIAPHHTFYVGYQQDGLWPTTETQSLGSFTDMSLDTRGVVNLTIVREEGGIFVRTGYKVYDCESTLISRIHTLAMLSSRGSEFKVMRETPGALYAVRVYNRVLTEEERAQNHFADVCNYYELDLTNFYNTVILPEERRQEVYNAMLSVDFSLSKEKAQEVLTSAVFASMISFDGFSVKTQGVGDELAAIFTVNNNQINELLSSGYKVTYGGIIADADANPADIVYNSTSDDVRVFYLFSNNDSVTTTPVFIRQSENENQFGLSVFYDAVTAPADYSKAYLFRTFALIETPDAVLVAYFDATSDNIGTSVSLYSALDYLTSLDTYHANKKMLSSMDNAFNKYNVYVDIENGSDSNNGGKNTPVKTIEKALELALDLINTEAMPEVNINIASGKYELDETITLDKESVTADFYRLNFKSYEAEAPIITGTFEIPGSKFQLYDAEKNIYTYFLPPSMKDENGNYPLFNNLYVDGKMATLAESEWFAMRHDEYKTTEGYFTVWVPAELLTGVVEKDENGEYYKLVNKKIFESMRWAVRMQWYYYDLVIESIDIETTNTVKEIPRLVEGNDGAYVVPDNPTMNPTEGYIALKFYGDHGKTFNKSHASPDNLTGRQGIDYMAKLSGNMVFLDEAGEFYYDQVKGQFYYIPTEGQNVSELTFDVPTIETLFQINDLHDISFDGLLLTGTDTKYVPTYGFTGGQAGSQKRTIGGNAFIHEGAIIGKNVANITIENCTFTDIYYMGVNFYGIVKGVTIDSCVFTNIGGGAIQLGAAAVSKTENNTNIRITNNYMDEIAILYYNNCAVTLTNVKNGKILNNSIIDCAYTGISVGWSWTQTTAPVGTYFNVFNCEIAYNYIENFMFMMHDGGSIYTLGGNAPKEYKYYLNELHHNYSYCGSKSGHKTVDHTSTALYHDGGSSHWYTHDNVTWVDQSTLCEWNYISIQAGSTSQAYNILAENNYFINLYQKHLTLGYGRVRDDWNVIESDSYLLTTLDPSEFNDTYISVNKVHTVSKNPANWAPFSQSGRLEIMNETIAYSGCDLFGGIYRGESLGDLAYNYNYRLLTYKETWYNPDIANPNYADR